MTKTKLALVSFFLSTSLIFSSCIIIDATTTLVKYTGKAVIGTVKITGKAIKGTANLIQGKKKIPLEQQGNSYYVSAKINKKSTIKLLLDTGATSVQIPMSLAKEMKLNLKKAEKVEVRLADGSSTWAYLVILKEMRLENVKVKKIEAFVLENDHDKKAGLLGMSFLSHFNFKIDTNKNLLILENKN